MHPTIKLIAEFVALASDVITLLLGVIALVGLVTQRNKISLMVRLYLNNHFNQRVKKIHETILKLQGVDYNEKSQKAEVIRLLHALSGQIRPWARQKKELVPILSRLEAISRKEIKISEGLKTEIAHELEETLETMFLSEITDVGAAKEVVK